MLYKNTRINPEKEQNYIVKNCFYNQKRVLRFMKSVGKWTIAPLLLQLKEKVKEYVYFGSKKTNTIEGRKTPCCRHLRLM